MPVGFELAAANVPERKAAAEILERVSVEGRVVLTDKGFAGREFEQLVADLGGRLARPDRKDEPLRFGSLGGARQWIESVFNTLKDQLSLERHRGRTLAEDVVTGGHDLDARRVVAEVLPTIGRHIHVPIFKYLREAGLMDDHGTLKDKASVDERVADRVDRIQDHFRVAQGYEKRAAVAVEEAGDFKRLARLCRPRDVLIAAPLLAREKQDPAGLRRFLLKNREPDGDAVFYQTLWHRGICLYDWLQYARRPGAARPRGRRRRQRTQGKRTASGRSSGKRSSS